MYNFALSDAVLDFAILIPTATGGIPVPGRIAWSSSMLYKTTGDWPTTSSAFRTPPSNVLAFQTAVLYQPISFATSATPSDSILSR